MKTETAKKRIANAVKRELKGEDQKVQDYVSNLIFSCYQCYENDNTSSYTSTENLNFAIDTNLFSGGREELLNEARRETSK